MRSKSLSLADLMKLVAIDDSGLEGAVEKTYDWEHSRRLEVGKWLLASGSAVFAAAVALWAKDNPPPTLLTSGLAALAGLMVCFGFGAIGQARTIAARYARTRAICYELKAVRPFLVRLRKEGHL
jgi:hypothetical protein